jgi:hypothetical protein
MKLLRIFLPLAAVLVAQGALGSTVGLTGSPTLDIWWRNGAIENATDMHVGQVGFSVGENGDFEAGSQTFTWGQGDQQDTIYFYGADGNIDPFVNFGFGIVDSGAASIFSFAFSSPVAPTIYGLVNYTLDLAGSFSNGSPNNGGSISMASPNTLGILEGILNATAIDGIGTAASFLSGGSSTYGPFASSGTYDCGMAGCTLLGTRLSFLGSGGSDAYSFTGRFEITPVPVPAAVWMFGSAIGLLGVMRRRAVR